MRNQLLGGRYRILERIGEGGMAYVYVAMDEKLGRKVAIKVLHEHMEKNPDIRKRFQQEAQAVSGLDHPNIVKIYDFSGSQSDRLWIVTEVIHGKNLAQYVQQFTGGWLHPIIATCVVREICKALDKAHSQGIVHRDIKPENIMVTHEGRVKLMDFGIAKDIGKTSITLTGTFMGSPSYMSPEQIRGRNVDLRSDLYSLSVLFYEIVTGRLPFTGQTTHDVVLKIMDGQFTHPRFIVPALPDALNNMIVMGMSKDPAARFLSALDYGRSIDQLLSALEFDESHIELERYFKDRKGYEQRLARTRFGILAANTLAARQRQSQHHIASATTRDRQPTPMRPTNSPRSSSQIRSRVRPQTPTDMLPARPSSKTRHEPASPFRGDDTWHRHVAASANANPSRSYHSVPTPPPALPAERHRNPSYPPSASGQAQGESQYQGAAAAPSQPAYGQAQCVNDGRRPVANAVYGVARAAPKQQRAVRIARRAPVGIATRQSFLSYTFGVLLVAVIGGISIWGFWELQNRLTNSRDFRQTHLTEKINKRQHPRATNATRPLRRVSKASPVDHGAPDSGTKLPRPALHRPPTEPTRPAERVARRRSEPELAARQNQREQHEAKHPQRASGPASGGSTPSRVDRRAELTERTGRDERTQRPVFTQTSDDGKVVVESTEVEHPRRNTHADDDSDKREPAAVGGNGKVSFSSQPAAEIYVDGHRLGTTIDNTSSSGWLELAAGAHTYELRRQGYGTERGRFTVESGEQKAIPRVVLNAGDARPNAHYSLTLRVKPLPAQVTIRSLDKNTTQAFTLKTPTRVVELEAGHYAVKVEYNGNAKERDLVLSGATTHLTFAAEFKDEE